MYLNPAIRKAIDASKLHNFTQEQFARPTRPVNSSRYLHLRHKPTVVKPVKTQSGTTMALDPGHVDLSLSLLELDLSQADLQKGAKEHPKFAELLNALGLDGRLTMGHAPAITPDNRLRAYRERGSMGVDYDNVEYKALPWYAECSSMKEGNLVSNDIGRLRPTHLPVLFKVCREQLQLNYSLGGEEKALPATVWTLEEFTEYFKTNVVPHGAPNCCDFVAACLAALARCEAPDTPGLNTFLYQLGMARRPQDVAELAAAWFKPDKEGFVSFAAPGDPPEPELSDEELIWADSLKSMRAREAEQAKSRLESFRKSSNFEAFAQAFGGNREVFESIAAALHQDNSIFDAIFSTGADLAWGCSFFKGLGERLAGCDQGQGVAAVMYHQDTYPGRISHVSAMGFSPLGQVSISHHESIPIADKPAMVDGLAIGTLGIPACSYNTVSLHNQAQNRALGQGLQQHELPIYRSYIASGPPMATFTPLGSFEGFAAFNVQLAAQGQGSLGRQWLYGVDPNQKLSELAAGIRAGKVQLTAVQLEMLRSDRALAQHPKLPPPGAQGEFVPGLYTNNCGRMTLLALLAGRAPALQGVNYSDTMDLVDVACILLQAGLMPNTDPLVLDRMRRSGYVFNKDKHAVERHPASFLALGQLSGWSNAAPGTPGTYPPDVDRQPPKDPAALAKARQDGDARLVQTIQKNEQTFIDQYGLKPETTPELPWVVRELSLDKDKALIEAHLAGLSDDDRIQRFGVANLAVATNLVLSSRLSVHFGVFDPKGKACVALGMCNHPVWAKLPSIQVGLSVLPASRKKGVSRAAMQWALARGRNRGVVRLEAQYFSNNTTVRKLLASLGKPIDLNENEAIQQSTLWLRAPDDASRRLEAAHLRISSAWPRS